MTAADAAFLGLDDGGGRHSMQIEARHCTSHDFLYGGSGVAACAAAAEAVTGRPLVWITTQYIGQARPGSDWSSTSTCSSPPARPARRSSRPRRRPTRAARHHGAHRSPGG
ncbi:MAG: hypothetical protein R2713_01375 [Ilumatobacteraceae bacterium]